MIEPNNIDELEDFFAYDDGVYHEEEEFFEGDYPDEKEGERSENTIVIDELEGTDFSSLNGDFKSSLKKLSRIHSGNELKINKVIAPKDRTVIVEGIHRGEPKRTLQKKKKTKKVVNSLKLTKDWEVKKHAEIFSQGKSTKRIIVPRDREVIIEGVNKFITGNDCNADDIRTIGYCNGKKLKEMLFTMNNEGNLDFTFEFFNPSSVIDYLLATSQNINDRILVAGSGVQNVQYTDVLYHMMSNPTKIHNCKIIISAPTEQKLFDQRDINFRMTQKDLRAYMDIQSLNIPQLLDRYQFQSNIVAFNFNKELNRPYVPDGLDVLRYTVLAGCTVSIAFYYEQKMLKKYFYKELRDNPRIF